VPLATILAEDFSSSVVFSVFNKHTTDTKSLAEITDEFATKDAPTHPLKKKTIVLDVFRSLQI